MKVPKGIKITMAGKTYRPGDEIDEKLYEKATGKSPVEKKQAVKKEK